MRQMFKTKPVDGLLIVKCLSIMLVVANHAQLATGLHGGLNGLILVSGIIMATFAFRQTTANTLISFGRFSQRLAIPSLILALIWAVAYQEFNWAEFLMIRNWFTIVRLVSFPIWYPQVMIQMMFTLSLIFWVFNLTPKLINRPKAVTVILLLLSISVCLFSYAVWDTTYLHDKLPHLLAWNFIFGWLYWAFAIKDKKTLKNKLILSLALACISYLAFIYSGAIYGDVRFAWLMLFGMIAIWVDELNIPYAFAHTFQLVGQSTLYIFLWHYPSFGITLRLGQMLGFENIKDCSGLMFCSGIIYPVLLWAGVTAMKRAYINIREEHLS